MAEVDLATGELRALAGRDFIEAIQEALDSCAVLVALIGRQWTTIADEQGRRRLDSPDDFVRAEVRTALDRGVRVIPVLVDRAKPPRQQELPAELHQLARLNAFDLSYDRFQYDAGQLLDLIQRELAAVRDQEEADRQAREVQPDGNSVGETAHEAPEPVQNDRTRAARPIADADVARLIADAERIAQSITDQITKVETLLKIANPTDRHRAQPPLPGELGAFRLLIRSYRD